MKRVCFVLPSLAGGGAERVAVQVLSALDERRWDRSMYLFKREGPYLAELPAGVRLSSATSTRDGYPLMRPECASGGCEHPSAPSTLLITHNSSATLTGFRRVALQHSRERSLFA